MCAQAHTTWFEREHKIEVKGSPNGIFGSWAWYTQGSAKYTELLGRRRRRRRHLENDQIWAKLIFLQNWHVPKFQDMPFSRNKSPCGSIPQKVTLPELTLSELIHFWDLKNGGTPHFRDFGDVFQRLCQFWSKTKMVRMVYTNNFYAIGLEICGPKDELWTKSKILEGWEISQFSFGAQGGVLRVYINPKLILEISWTIPDPF